MLKSQLSLPVNGPFYLKQLLTCCFLPWEVILTLLSSCDGQVSRRFKISLAPVAQCTSWGLIKKQNNVLFRWPQCFPVSGAWHLPPESALKSYCSFSVEGDTNWHLFLTYFISHCFIVPYKWLITDLPDYCWLRTGFMIRYRTGSK